HNTDGTLRPDMITQAGAITSVNGKTAQNGSVLLAATDIGALTQSEADARYPLTSALNGLYVKPGSGIPETDLSQTVRDSLTAASSAVQASMATSKGD